MNRDAPTCLAAPDRRSARLASAPLIACLLVVAGASAALPLARSAAAAEQPLIVLPCAATSTGPRILLGRRVAIRPARGTQPATVPQWAGQWTPVAGTAQVTTVSLTTLAQRLFGSQTGQPLPGAASAVSQSDPTDFDVTKVVLFPMGEAQLEQIADAAQQAIAAGTPSQGVLAEVQVVSMPEALQLVGPVSPPPDGWAAYVVQQVYGGTGPGALDTTFPILVTMLSERSVQSASPFQQAFLSVGTVCGDLSPRPAR